MTDGIYSNPEWYPETLTPTSSFEASQGYLHATRPEKCPQPCEPMKYFPPQEACVTQTVPFALDQVINSNLGGKGPDWRGEKTLHFKKVGNIKGQSFDLIVKTTSRYF